MATVTNCVSETEAARNPMIGIFLAGGSGARLYQLSVLVLVGLRDI